MAAETSVSIGVVLSGALILATGSAWIDPLVSIIIAALIGIGSWRLLRSSAHLAVDGIPESINKAAVTAYLASLPGATDVHDTFTQQVADVLEHQFGIAHATIQLEHGNGPSCPPEASRCGLGKSEGHSMAAKPETLKPITLTFSDHLIEQMIKRHDLKDSDAQDTAKVAAIAQRLFDAAVGLPEDAWHAWDDWAAGLLV